ncbi:UDP-2,4-diacetamido-2,4,6-trideoxy-beta-L-altropyranose hydrolase [uncultured Paraglaciecola sp.]|uniref:UDP-2,4-diacetamido-2,4, 6-trideoxy-beta-L-altropyranose hydrolase n=1 Tax=uncultured Paraglaciecola sp. TaxID=1765024 RepID=UPI0030DD2262
MLAKPRIAFYGNSSHNVGAGHIMRLFALAQVACDQFDVLFIYKTCSQHLLTKLESEGFASKKVNTPFTISDVTKLSISIVVVDDYHLSKAEWTGLQDANVYIVALDDNINSEALLADFVINPAADTNLVEYKKRAPNAEFCLGPKYSYLRKDFTSCAFVPLQARPNILVALGGTDPMSIALPLCQSLVNLGLDCNIELLVGEKHRDHKALMQLNVHNERFSVVLNPDSVAQHMMQAGLAISAAGGTLGELASLGVPTLALVIADNQKSALHPPTRKPWYRALDVRDWQKPSEPHFEQFNSQLLNKITSMTAALWRDNCGREHMSNTARQLVDTHGCQRIIDKLAYCLDKR